MNNVAIPKSVLFVASVNSCHISIEEAVRENDISSLMRILMRENISMLKLLALQAGDVNQDTCEITIKNIAALKKNNFYIKPMRNFQKILFSKDSVKLLISEIQKNLFSGKVNNFIFADRNGEFYRPSYYVEKFRELSERVGFAVTPKNLNAIYKSFLFSRNIDDYFAAYMEALRCS